MSRRSGVAVSRGKHCCVVVGMTTIFSRFLVWTCGNVLQNVIAKLNLFALGYKGIKSACFMYIYLFYFSNVFICLF